MQSDGFTIFYIFTVDCLGNERFFPVAYKRRISYECRDLGDRMNFNNLATYCVQWHHIFVRLSEIERFLCTSPNKFVLSVHSGARSSGN